MPLFLRVLTDCQRATSHATLVLRGPGNGECVRVCVSFMLAVRVHPTAPTTSRKTQTPSWVLKTMHILISLIIHPYVTDEGILVSVSGAGNVRGGGRLRRVRGVLFKAQMTAFLQEPRPPPVRSAGRDETLTRPRPCDVERN